MSEHEKTVNVICAHPNGLQLRLYKQHHAAGPLGAKMPDPTTGIVQLNGGGNVVDADFMKAWLEENHGNDLLVNGTIKVVEPGESPPEGEPGVDNIVGRPDKESSIDAPAPKDEKDSAAQGGEPQQQ